MKKLLPKSDFSRNVLTLMTGTTVAQAIPVAISPILTRIYTPEDFGVFALFVAVTSVFGSIANGRYELAIMLPSSDEEALNIAAVGLSIAVMLSIFLMCIVAFFNDAIAKLLNNDDISLWLYFMPITVFFAGLFNVLNYLNNRLKNYKDIARAVVAKSLVLAVVQLSIGFFKSGAMGLVSGQILSSFVANIKLSMNISSKINIRKSISYPKMSSLANRYKDFPKYTLWATLANNISQHLTSILMPTFYSVATLGHYALTQRALGFPSSLIGHSVGQVYFQAANAEKLRTGSAATIFNNTVKKLTALSLPIFIILYFTVEDLFSFVFGKDWAVAGQYAKILIPLFLIRFIFSPVSVTFSTFEKQRLALLMQVGLMLLTLFVIVVSGVFDIDFKIFLHAYSLSLTIYYFFFLYIAYLVASE